MSTTTRSQSGTAALAGAELSEMELTERVLAMAKTGVYRESVFEALQPLATKKQIRAAIAQAKQFGLESDASLRDPELGTYYHIEATKYQSFQLAQRADVPLDQPEELLEWVMQAQSMMRLMVGIAGTMSAFLVVTGSLCMISGRSQLGVNLWIASSGTISLWFLQKSLAQRAL